MELDHGGGHPVQEVPTEESRVLAARSSHRMRRTVHILAECAANALYALICGLAFLLLEYRVRLGLVLYLRSVAADGRHRRRVSTEAHLVLGGDFLHARRVLQVFFLVRAVVAELVNHDAGAVEKFPEVFAMLQVHAHPRVRMYALESRLQVGADLLQVRFARCERQARISEHRNRLRALDQLILTAGSSLMTSDSRRNQGNK